MPFKHIQQTNPPVMFAFILPPFFLYRVNHTSIFQLSERHAATTYIKDSHCIINHIHILRFSGYIIYTVLAVLAFFNILIPFFHGYITFISIQFFKVSPWRSLSMAQWLECFLFACHFGLVPQTEVFFIIIS